MKQFTVSPPFSLENTRPSAFYQTFTPQRNDSQPFLTQQQLCQFNPIKYQSQEFARIKHLPYTTSHQTFQAPAKVQNIQKSLFADRASMKQMKASVSKQKNHEKIPLSKQLLRPKIVFSYEKSKINKEKANIFSQSYHHESIQQPVGQLNAQSIFLEKNNETKAKKFKICSNQLSYLIQPRKIPKKLKKYSDIYRTTAKSSSKKVYNNSQSMKMSTKQQIIKNKESKVASTQATRSFQTENCLSNTSQFSNKKRNQESIKNSFEEGEFSLINKLQPAKVLKQTLSISRYDFGGILKHTSTQCQKQIESTKQESESSKWLSCVKGLFSDNQNLKSSIHCGPDVRLNQDKRQFLVGFGREVGQSCIAEEQIQ